jgi:2-amino-4-hydroxy-6-hydroxymethyldihydropteridine diphosphokinase
MEIETDLEPGALLHALQQIERSIGRPAKHERNAPRTLDLDLLYAGNLTLQSAELILPHPRIATRRFVLQPLADLRPELILPGTGRSVAALLSALPLSPAVNPWAQPI